MRIFRSHLNLPDDARGAVAAIGNFDGVHLGHQAVIAAARTEAQRSGAPLAILTFEPHPRSYFAPGAPPFRLMNAESRANRLAKLGVDILFELPFNADLAGLPAADFAREILGNGLGLSHVVVGQDFRFGKGRDGEANDLPRFGAQMGFGATVAELVDFGGADISSTRIREALAAGRPRDAAQMLGHWHRIDGPVLHGDKRGRELGYPTANMSVDGLHPPCFGVYAVLVDVLTGPHKGSYRAVASAGVRPMFGANTPNIESHLFDFSGDLYGEHLSVGLIDWLRPEQKFDSLDALIAQMDRDSAKARAILDVL